MDNRMKKARMNAASTVLHQLIALSCGLIIPGIMIDTFGSEAYGATTSIAQFLSYIALFEGGIGRVARGALYRPLALRDEEKISGLYLAVKRFFTLIGIAFAGYALILALSYFDLADVKVFTRQYTFFLVLSIALGKFAEYMGGISNVTLFNADGRQYVVNAAYMVTNVLNALLIVLLAHSGADILWVKLGSSLIFVLRPLFFTLYLKSHYAIKKSKNKAVLANKFTGIAQHAAYVVQNNTDVLILTLLADLKYVAVYSVYHLIIFNIRNLVTAFTGGMEAVFGNMIAGGEEETLRKTYKEYKLILTVLTVTFFSATAVLILPFVKLYTAGVTDADYIRPLFALIMVLAEALNCLVLPCFNLTIAAGKLKESRMGAYGEALVNLTVSLLLVLWNPLVGVALGTLASALYKCVFYMVFSGRHILKMKAGVILRDLALTCGVIAALSCGGLLLSSLLPISNYLLWVLFALATVAVTGGCGLLLGALLYPGRVKGALSSLLKKVKK